MTDCRVAEKRKHYFKQLGHPIAEGDIFVLQSCNCQYNSHLNSIRAIIFVSLLTSTILEAEVGEPPHIAQSNRVGNAGEGKVELAAPGPPLIDLPVLLLRLQLGLISSLVPSLVYQDVERFGQLFPLGHQDHCDCWRD